MNCPKCNHPLPPNPYICPLCGRMFQRKKNKKNEKKKNDMLTPIMMATSIAASELLSSHKKMKQSNQQINNVKIPSVIGYIGVFIIFALLFALLLKFFEVI